MQEGIFIHFFSSGPQIQRGSSRHGEGRSHGNNELVVEKGEYYGNENTGKNYGFSKAVSRARMPLSWYRLTERIWCASLISRKQKGEWVILNIINDFFLLNLYIYRASKLTDEARLVYNAIRAAGNEGIWTRELKKKTGLHTIVLNRTLKLLEQKQEIKSVKHVKFPTRKIYMLFDITPSSEVTGGAWYTDQELDTEFIDSLKTACLKYITGRVSVM